MKNEKLVHVINIKWHEDAEVFPKEEIISLDILENFGDKFDASKFNTPFNACMELRKAVEDYLNFSYGIVENFEIEEKTMKRYRLPVSWQVIDTVEVPAGSLKEAIEWFQKNMDKVPLGKNPEYLQDSYSLDDGENEDIDDICEYITETTNVSDTNPSGKED